MFTRNISQILAGHSDKLFVIDRKGNLRIVDNETGKVLGTIPTHENLIPITNHINDRIYLVSSNGLVQCIRDVNAVKPIFHDEESVTTLFDAKNPPSHLLKKYPWIATWLASNSSVQKALRDEEPGREEEAEADIQTLE